MTDVMAVSDLIRSIVGRFNDVLEGEDFAPSSDCCSNRRYRWSGQINVDKFIE